MQTALVEMVESLELSSEGAMGSFAARQFVGRRLDLGIMDCVEQSHDGAGEGVPRTAEDGLRVAGLERMSHWPLLIGSPGQNGGVFRGESSCGELSRDEAKLRQGIAEGAGLAHDVGNLLGALGLYAELLATPGVLHEEYRGYAEDLRLLSDRSSAMMTRLVARQEKQEDRGGSLTVLPAVVARLRGLLSRIAGRRIEVELGQNSHRPVNVSEEVVERILTNLVKNAGESMEDGRDTITVRVDGTGRGSDARLVMTVSDHGRGMTGAQLRALGDAARPGANGRGLGFRVVRELAALSEGLVGIASAPGEGTTVSVEWRAVEQMEVEAQGTTRTVTRGAAAWIGC